jgi:DNA (cytosine-5)-methyltransferase 1
MTAYYNEIDPYAAQWLRNLIAAGHIAPGIVDERSIEDVTSNELKHYTQCHFFAGIGVWSLALRRAGWPDDRPVWTGSCPCQPFSSAGKGGGFDDERHLWPAFHHLIEQCRPATVIGEQVASKDAEPWLDLVQADLEAVGYAFGAVPFPSASVGAPHIRDRLYWVADAKSVRSGQGFSDGTGGFERSNEEQGAKSVIGNGIGELADTVNEGSQGWVRGGQDTGRQDKHGYAGRSGTAIGLADTAEPGHGGSDESQSSGVRDATERHGAVGGMADTNSILPELGVSHTGRAGSQKREITSRCGIPNGRPGPTNGFWGAADWLLCRDGKWRPVESGTFPLVNGASSRVGRLRAYGNAINAQAAQVFIECIK